MKQGTTFTLEVNPKIPRKLIRLEELANNLWYSWDKPTRTLFARLHPGLWDAVGHNPKVFLRRVDEQRLLDAVEDQVFLATYNRVLSAYDTYHHELVRHNGDSTLNDRDLVAYFCAEFGFHESFPIYSGGLGILAGDHCKAASDMRVPFVAVGLLYRQGYFTQTIECDGGKQIASYADSDFNELPVTPALRDDGGEIHLTVELPGRQVEVKVWQAIVGHVRLYLLDTDLETNTPDDRNIAHQLYGGDRTLRIKQEIILGIGGVRALQALGIKPTVWHINEGHAAFLILERVRHLMAEFGLDFASALEAVAVNTVFTTHTPVPAGHDHFSDGMIAEYFQHFCQGIKIGVSDVMQLGLTPESPEFNMTALAIRGSRHQNGVSRIHGSVSSRICSALWPEVLPEENPMAYVTNGVHVPTFLAQEWADLFDNVFGYEWRHRMSDPDFWNRIDEIPDQLFWSVRQSLKSQMLQLVRFRKSAQHFRSHGSESHLDRMLKLVDSYDPNVLTIGFARRFATYKRAALLFENLEWLKEILSNEERPVLFLFAGKAHPADQPGQDLIRQVQSISNMPEFEGKVMLVEGYDLGLARRLVAGVDVWLNNPVYPLEASGTSGMKAGMNGAINLSVLDGWWGEGYDGSNGWAIKPAPTWMESYRRDKEEAQTLYEILQDKVIPAYYERGKMGYSPDWVKMSKRSMATILPRFNSGRMVDEYVSRFYSPASLQGRRYEEEDFAAAKLLSAWKKKVRFAWPGLTLQRTDAPLKRISFGEVVRLEVALNMNGLAPEDVVVELLIRRPTRRDKLDYLHFGFSFYGMSTDGKEHLFALDLTPDLCGRLDYKIRAYPFHDLLTHPLEMGLMQWL
ncbi:MAG: alpha-glucan family phosphorylase [Sulfuricella denitrificans]|nr:alpha-glucan family phosphorylase [Sulfuricella denitrificans]